MSAAYLYHIANNHPLIDGNKRTSLANALVFLYMNGYDVNRYSQGLYEIVIGGREGSDLSQWFIDRT